MCHQMLNWVAAYDPINVKVEHTKTQVATWDSNIASGKSGRLVFASIN